MKRPVVAASLVAALLASGCAAEQTVLPAGDDPNKLAEAIAERGQGKGLVQPDAPGSFVLADSLKTGKKIGESCALISVVCAYLLARGQPSDENMLREAWHKIWSDDS